MSSIFRIEHDKGAQLWGYPGYRVVHAASGLRVTSRYTRAKAEAVVAWLESLPGVNWDFTRLDSEAGQAAIRALKKAPEFRPPRRDSLLPLWGVARFYYVRPFGYHREGLLAKRFPVSFLS